MTGPSVAKLGPIQHPQLKAARISVISVSNIFVPIIRVSTFSKRKYFASAAKSVGASGKSEEVYNEISAYIDEEIDDINTDYSIEVYGMAQFSSTGTVWLYENGFF